MKITSKNYQNLLLEIRKTIKEAEQNLVKSVNRQKVILSWEIGKKIDQHLVELEESSEGKYGKYLLEQLSEGAGIDKRTLYQMHAFYKTYPKLPSEKSNLTWSHYRNLVSVQSETKRQLLEDLTVKSDLDSKELQKEISKINSAKKKKSAAKKSPNLRVTRGELFTYSLNKDKEVDLGFNVFVHRASCVVLGGASVKIPEARSTKHQARNEFTYVAELERVVDGDTIHVKLDLGFGIKHREILRLAQIEAEEAETKNGKKATAGLKKSLQDVSFLSVKTNKTDIYGRYIADVFFDETKKETDPRKVAASGVYLNQLLLDKGLVEVY